MRFAFFHVPPLVGVAVLVGVWVAVRVAVDRVSDPYGQRDVKPQQLNHIVLNTGNRAALEQFYGKMLATGGDDEAARLWDAESGQLLCTLEGHAGPVTGLAFSPDGRRLATAGEGSDATVRLWDVATGRELLQLAGASRCVAFSPDGKRLAAAGSNGQVLLWTANSGK